MLRQIFISYSVREPGPGVVVPPGTQAFVKDIYQRLYDSRDFEPFLDSKDIPPGANWFDYIHVWLSRCHACILVISEESLNSQFVYTEVGVMINRLVNRDEYDPFVMIPVLLGASGANRLEKVGLGRTRVGRYQVLDCADPLDPSSRKSSCDEILRELNKLTRSIARTPQQRLALEAASHLEKFETHENLSDILIAIGKELLGWDDGPHGGGKEVLNKLANDLVMRPLPDVRPVLHRLIDRGCRNVESLLDIVAPRWIPDRIASQVAQTMFGVPENRTMVIAESDTIWGQLCIGRSMNLPLSRVPEWVEPPSPISENLSDEIVQELNDQFRSSNRPEGHRRQRRVRGPGDPVNDVKRKLQNMEEDRVPVFVVFILISEDHDTDMLAGIDFGLIAKLRKHDALKTINIFILIDRDKDLPADTSTAKFNRLETLDEQHGREIIDAYDLIDKKIPK